MLRLSLSMVCVSAVAALLSLPAARAQTTVIVAAPAKAGAVEGTTENSDAFIWRLFTEFAAPASEASPSPVLFETWASDEDTFSAHPHWPAPGEPVKLHQSPLAILKTLGSQDISPTRLHSRIIDVPCNSPRGAAVGGFPTSDPKTQCIAEQVARNRVQFDYIVNNNLNTQAGLAAAYAKSFKVEMPTESLAVKGDWVPLSALLQWIPQLADVENIRKLYYTTTVNSVEYALVALHVSSRQNPNWVWGTFEHQLNPGRCDSMGCLDSFGAEIPEVLPNRTAFNTQYGACPKTTPLKALMVRAKLSPVWENYCLKSTEVDFTATDGTPYVLGNSVIEGIVGNGTVAASSCISCHYYASFGPEGKPAPSAMAILPFNPTGKPITGVVAGSQQFAFMWGLVFAPGK